MPLPRPYFSHSLATTVFDTEVAVIDDREWLKYLERQGTELKNLQHVSAFEEVNVLKYVKKVPLPSTMRGHFHPNKETSH
jgi:hypothetical protein